MKYHSWYDSFKIAEEFFIQYGNLNIPVNYVMNGYNIGTWLSNQRVKKRKGLLSDDKIASLESINIVWDGHQIKESVHDREFTEKVDLIRQYREQYGDTRVPNSYEVNGIKLGAWAANVRGSKRGKGTIKLTPKRLKMLNDIEFEFDWYQETLESAWEEMYLTLTQYCVNHDIAEIIEGTNFNNRPIGNWIHSQRNAYKSGKLEKTRYEKLLELGLDFSPLEGRWEKAYGLAKQFYEQFHNLDVPDGYIMDGFNLGAWISNQRQIYNRSRTDMILDETQIKKLNALGMTWQSSGASNTSFAEQAIFFYLRQYYPDVIDRDKSSGIELDIYIPSLSTAIEYDGVHWHHEKLKRDNAKDVKCKQAGIKLIRIREYPLPDTENAICYHRSNRYDNHSLETVLDELFRSEFGVSVDVNISRDTFEITRNFQRFASKTWYSFYREAEFYYKKNGNLLIPAKYITESKMHLGSWIQNQRQIYKGQSDQHISKKEIEMLEMIGMVWDVREYDWYNNYCVAKKYFEEYGNLLVSRKCEYQGVRLGKWINTQRNVYNGNRRHSMSEKRIQLLESIGMVWNTKE